MVRGTVLRLGGESQRRLTMLDLCSALDRHADRRSDQLALRFLPDGDADGRTIELTFGALRARALAAAAVLQEHLSPGDRACF